MIHGAATVDRNLATDYGVAGYDDDIDRAYTSERLGGEEANPFVVRAMGTAGRITRATPSSTTSMPHKCYKPTRLATFLRQGRVTFPPRPRASSL